MKSLSHFFLSGVESDSVFLFLHVLYEECGLHFFFPFKCFKATVTCQDQTVPITFKAEEESCGRRKLEESVLPCVLKES